MSTAPKKLQMAMFSVLLISALVSCKKKTEPHTVAPDCEEYELAAKPTLTTWCTPCHSSQIEGTFRSGAPIGSDFDGLELTKAAAERIVVRFIDEQDMPPAGGPRQEERDRFLKWFECGMPGSEEPEFAICSDPISSATLTECGEQGVIVTGDYTLNDPTLAACLCEVQGNLTVSTPSPISELTEVLGTLTTKDSTAVVAAKLTSVGSLTLTGSSLKEVNLPHLASSGELSITDAASLDTLELPLLTTVSGAFTLSQLPLLKSPKLFHLRTVAGDFTVANSGVETLVGINALEEIQGTLLLSNLPSLQDVDDFGELASLGGDLIIEETGAITLDGFHRLRTIPGNLHLTSNPNLTGGIGFLVLETIEGDLLWHDNSVLEGFNGLGALQSANALGFSQLPIWEPPAFDLLSSCPNLSFVDLPSTTVMPSFPLLTEVQNLTVHNCPQLRNLGLTSLVALENSEIINVPSLNVERYETWKANTNLVNEVFTP